VLDCKSGCKSEEGHFYKNRPKKEGILLFCSRFGQGQLMINQGMWMRSHKDDAFYKAAIFPREFRKS
jgi:hypothetical protein